MTRLISKQKTWKALSLALGGPAGYLFVKKGLPLFLMKSMRNSELEADLLGLEYQYASGYDPDEFVRLLRVLDEGGETASLWDRLTDSHPLTDARVSHAQSDIARYLPTRIDYITDTSEFQEVKTRVANLMGISDSDWNSAASSSFTGESFQPLATKP
jgi:predicted Zn-dependent protease